MAVTDGQQTPTLEQIILDGVKAATSNLNVAMPGVVIEYDPATQKCSVQPSIKRVYDDGTTVNLPIITNVPVAFPRAGKAFISLPIKADDTVLLIFSQRSIDKWLSQGGVVKADDPRMHSLSDAVAIAGVYPFTDSIDASADHIRIQNDKSIIDVKADGTYQIKNDSNELMDLVVQLVDAIIAMKINTMLGPQPPVNLATFTALKPKFESLKG